MRVLTGLSVVAVLALVATPAFSGECQKIVEELELDFARKKHDKLIPQVLRVCRPRADKGDADAEYAIGRMHDQGWGVKYSLATAFDFYLRAAKKEHVTAQIYVGRYYENGIGSVKKDGRKAIMWFGRAAAKGSADGHYHLGAASFWIKGDRKGQVKHLRIAALKSHAGARSYLAGLYEEGKSLERDLVCAYFWYRTVPFGTGLDYVQHRHRARRDLEKLKKKIARSAAASGERLFEAWRKADSFSAVKSQNRCV